MWHAYLAVGRPAEACHVLPPVTIMRSTGLSAAGIVRPSSEDGQLSAAPASGGLFANERMVETAALGLKPLARALRDG